MASAFGPSRSDPYLDPQSSQAVVAGATFRQNQEDGLAALLESPTKRHRQFRCRSSTRQSKRHRQFRCRSSTRQSERHFMNAQLVLLAGDTAPGRPRPKAVAFLCGP
jgi:hypothetical protein